MFRHNSIFPLLHFGAHACLTFRAGLVARWNLFAGIKFQSWANCPTRTFSKPNSTRRSHKTARAIPGRTPVTTPHLAMAAQKRERFRRKECISGPPEVEAMTIVVASAEAPWIHVAS